MEYATNWKFILRFLKYLVKSFTGAVGKSLSETLDDLDDDGNLKTTNEEQEESTDTKT